MVDHRLLAGHEVVALRSVHSLQLVLLLLFHVLQLEVLGRHGQVQAHLLGLEHVPEYLPPLEQEALGRIVGHGKVWQVVFLGDVGHGGRGRRVVRTVGVIQMGRRFGGGRVECNAGEVRLAGKRLGGVRQRVFDQEVVYVRIQ